jgi:hypothetical protein
MEPWEEVGREWLEWVDEEETELDLEWGGWGKKSRGIFEVGIICILTAVISRRWSERKKKDGGSVWGFKGQPKKRTKRD